MEPFEHLSLATLVLLSGCSARLEPIGIGPLDGSPNDAGQVSCPGCPDAGPDDAAVGSDTSVPVTDAGAEECGSELLCIKVKFDTTSAAASAADQTNLRFAVVWIPGPNSRFGASAEVATSIAGGWKADANGLVKIRASDIGKPQSEALLACPRAKTDPYQCVSDAKIGYGAIFAFMDANGDNKFDYCPAPQICIWGEREYGVAKSAIFISSSGTYSQGTWPTPPNPNVTMPEWTKLFPMGAQSGVRGNALVKVNGSGDPDRPVPITGGVSTFDWTIKACVLGSIGGVVCSYDALALE